MRVWLANSGEYSDFRVHAAFTSEELAAQAGSNEPIEFEVLDSLPPRVYWRTMSQYFRLMHPVKSDHIHVPNPDDPDCPDTNVFVADDFADRSEVLFPWDDAPTLEPVKVTQGGSGISRWLQVEGTDSRKVEKAFHDAAGRIKAEMQGIA